MARTWIISDLHIGHEAVAKHFRGFDDIDVHDDYLVERWNAVVNKRDCVWVLGDVGFDRQRIDKYMGQMYGQKKLVMGNHDKYDTKFYLKHFYKLFGAVRYKQLLLTHIPVHPQELQFRGIIANVHGHIHDLDRNIKDPRYYNVNCDVMDQVCQPMTMDEVIGDINANLEFHKKDY